jgi:hypothetical protein
MRSLPRLTARGSFLVCLLFFSFSIFGIDLNDLRSAPDLTPRKFAAYFSDFEFKFHAEIQSPDAFLATRSGDCDDFSTLAASVLREKGYTPRLITVRMPGVTHVVCYIEETKSYLDYNYRGLNRCVDSAPNIEAIAESVAKSYNLKWTSASEFTYADGLKRLVQTAIAPKTAEKSFVGLFR